MLTADQRFAFDVNGYQVIEDALTPEQVQTINAQLDEFVRPANRSLLSELTSRGGRRRRSARAGSRPTRRSRTSARMRSRGSRSGCTSRTAGRRSGEP